MGSAIDPTNLQHSVVYKVQLFRISYIEVRKLVVQQLEQCFSSCVLLLLHAEQLTVLSRGFISQFPSLPGTKLETIWRRICSSRKAGLNVPLTACIAKISYHISQYHTPLHCPGRPKDVYVHTNRGRCQTIEVYTSQ